MDLSAPYILGSYLNNTDDRSVLYEMVKSPIMWEQRIAVVSTLMLIRNGQYADTVRLAEMLLNTSHDLIQKAVGWMLREVGKRDITVLRDFLDRHHAEMPRTMLRYSIEKLASEERRHYLQTII